MRSASVGALDQLHHERLDAVALLEPMNRRRCSDDSARRASCASRLNRARRSGSTRERVRQDFHARRRDCSFVSRGAIHLAHAARAEGGTNFIRAEASAGEQRHEAPDDRLALIVVEWDLSVSESSVVSGRYRVVQVLRRNCQQISAQPSENNASWMSARCGTRTRIRRN